MKFHTSDTFIDLVSDSDKRLLMQAQIKAYIAWVNAQLKKRSDGTRQVTDLKVDMHDGVALVDLIDIVGKCYHIHVNAISTIPLALIRQGCHPKQHVPDGKWTRKPLAYRESNNFLIYV